jgi:hypothetical protein
MRVRKAPDLAFHPLYPAFSFFFLHGALEDVSLLRRPLALFLARSFDLLGSLICSSLSLAARLPGSKLLDDHYFPFDH